MQVASRGEQSQPVLEFLTTAEAAELLGIQIARVRRALAAGRLPGRRVGPQWRTTRSAVLANGGLHAGPRMATSRDAAARSGRGRRVIDQAGKRVAPESRWSPSPSQLSTAAGAGFHSAATGELGELALSHFPAVPRAPAAHAACSPTVPGWAGGDATGRPPTPTRADSGAHVACPVEDPQQFATVGEVAARLQLSPRQVRRLLEEGVLPGVKLGRQWRIPWRQLREAWTHRNPN